MRRLLDLLLRRLTDDALASSALGDLEEGRRRRAARGYWRAGLWFYATLCALVIHVAWRVADDVAHEFVAGRLGATGLAGELRQALRALRRTPVTSLVVIGTFALGVGANAAIFSVVYAVLFKPLPFESPGRVVMLIGTLGSSEPSMYRTSLEDYKDIGRTNRSFSSMGIGGFWTFNVTDLDSPQRIVGMRVDGGFFPTLGTTPIRGRWLDASDDHASAGENVVISYGMWQRLLGGRDDAVGRVLRLNGVATTVVGVMPAAFRFPDEDVDLWAAIRDEMNGTPRNVRFWSAFGRLKPGVRLEQANADLQAIAANLAASFPDSNRTWSVKLLPALETLTTLVRDNLRLLLGAIVLVFLVAVVNVGGVLASRRASRAREFKLRAAIGATRARLARVTLFETAWLGATGLAAGLLAAWPAVALLRHWAPASLPRVNEIALAWPVIALASAAMLVVVLVTSFVPLGNAGRGRSGLVVIQVGLAFVLLSGAALLLRSFIRVVNVDPGVSTERVMTMRVFLGPPTYRSIEAQREFTARALDAIRATPGVEAAGVISQPVFDTEGSGSSQRFEIEGRSYEAGSTPSLMYRVTDPGYFDAMGMTLRAGRNLATSDLASSPLVVVINEAMARRYWPDGGAVGARFRWADNAKSQTQMVTIAGIVNDVATNGFEEAEPPAAYAPYTQRTVPFLRWLTVIVRTTGAPEGSVSAVRAVLQAVDPYQPIFAVRTMDEIVARAVSERRFALTIMTTLAALTVLLALLGLYGTLAHRVESRRREIGVRLSLGATRAMVVSLVLREGARLVIVGLLLGWAASYAVGRMIQSLLFGISPSDIGTRVLLGAALLSLGLIACLIPARRASRVDPMIALRSE